MNRNDSPGFAKISATPTEQHPGQGSPRGVYSFPSFFYTIHENGEEVRRALCLIQTFAALTQLNPRADPHNLVWSEEKWLTAGPRWQPLIILS